MVALNESPVMDSTSLESPMHAVKPWQEFKFRSDASLTFESPWVASDFNRQASHVVDSSLECDSCRAEHVEDPSVHSRTLCIAEVDDSNCTDSVSVAPIQKRRTLP